MPYSRAVYRAGDNHIHEAWKTSDTTGWHPADLSALGKIGVAAAGNPFGYVSPWDNTARVIWRRGHDGHIWELFLQPEGTWKGSDLSAQAGVNVAADGDPFGYVTPWDNTARVIWRRGHDGHIWELFLQPGGTWKGSDLSAQTSALTAVSDPIAYSSKDRCSVVYRGKQDPGDSAEYLCYLTIGPKRNWTFSSSDAYAECPQNDNNPNNAPTGPIAFRTDSGDMQLAYPDVVELEPKAIGEIHCYTTES